MVTYVVELNSSNFNEVISKNKIVLVDIKAIWCKPCTAMEPIIDQLSIDYNGQVTVSKLDADLNRDIVSELGIRNIPTILIYKNGELVDKNVGAASKQQLEDLVNKHL